MRYIWRGISHALLLAAGLAGAVALSAVAQDTERVPVEQATTQQKAKFVANLITRSVAARTIEDKGDAAAKASLARARALVEAARTDIAAARYKVANGKLDQALRLVNVEARKLSEAEVKSKRQRAAYDKRRNSVAIFLSAYERVADEKEVGAAAKAQVAHIRRLVRDAKARRSRIDALKEQAMGLRNEAESEAQTGDHAAAIETLGRSTLSLLKAIRMSGIWIPG